MSAGGVAPGQGSAQQVLQPARPPGLPGYAELHCRSNFSFLTGASHPEEMVMRAAELGLAAIAIADVNSVAGIVRAHVKAREVARDGGPVVRLIPAARLVLRDGFTVTALPQDRAGWGRLSRLLTLGRRRAPKGVCDLGLDDLLEWGDGLTLLIHPHTRMDGWRTQAERLVHRFGESCNLVLAPRYDGQDVARFARGMRVAAGLGIAAVASALPMMHHGARRKLAACSNGQHALAQRRRDQQYCAGQYMEEPS